MAIDTHLKDDLEKMDREFGGDNMYKMMGPTLLSYAATDSTRMYMYTSHIKQNVCISNPDVPRLATGFEKTIGEYNHAYKELDGEWEVKDVIDKFGNGLMYTVVLYNRDKDLYDMIERPVAENLTEKFGYLYNTKFMDNLKPGDVVKDDILYKSTSYYDDMNYRYGKNARIFYQISTDTLEDAIRVRRSWANEVKSTEVDDPYISLNTNDILLNMYGDDEHYKTIPDIGEKVKNSLLCATKRVNKAHILYDFQTENLREPSDTDTEYFVSKDAIVYDIEVFYNGDDPFPDNIFHKQLKFYYEKNCQYADEMLKWCNYIKYESGSKYTDNVSFFRSKYKHYNNPEYKWKDKDKQFAHIKVAFKVHAPVPLESGSKMSGRYGNKGVISTFAEDVPDTIKQSIINMIDPDMPEEEKAKMIEAMRIVDDERMPYYKNPYTGERINVDIVLNASGAIRRLNPSQLMEVETNFIAEQIQMKLPTLDTLQEKVDMIFKFLNLVNEDYCAFYMDMYKGFEYTETVSNRNIRFINTKEQEQFVRNVEETGFYLIRPPHNPILYNDIKAMYNAFPWIKPVDLYIDLFGIKGRKLMRSGVVGFEYMIFLKQTSRKNFSARSTFRINRANLPTKDNAKKTNKSSYAKTPVRLSEIYALMPAISGRDIAEYNIFFRSSPIGRKSLDRILKAEGNPLAIKKLKVMDNYTNINAQILAARLKCIGLRIDFITEGDSPVPDIYEDVPVDMQIHGYTIYDKWDRYEDYNRLFDIYDEENRSFDMIESYEGEKNDYIWDKIFEMEEVTKDLGFEMGDKELLKNLTTNHQVSLKEKLSKVKKKKKPLEVELKSNINKNASEEEEEEV